jgi:hypothetical protein
MEMFSDDLKGKKEVMPVTEKPNYIIKSDGDTAIDK